LWRFVPARNAQEPAVPHATLNMIFQELGETKAVAREAKHAANGASQKIDAVGGKVDSLALVVATQGHLKENVEELKAEVKEQASEIEILKADKHRREGAIGLVEWISKHWPFLGLSAFLAAWVAFANGLFK
jgi:hypothetical protein